MVAIVAFLVFGILFRTSLAGRRYKNVLSVLFASGFAALTTGVWLVTFLFDCGYAWCIVTPVAFAVTYLTSLPVIPIYAITLFAEATKCIVGFIIVKRGRWLKQLS